MNRSYLALVMAFTLAPLTYAPDKKTDGDSLVTVETRKFEVITKATLHYFKVAKRTAFSTFNHELEFVTEERLNEFNRYEDAQKHSFAVKSTCQPVKELLEILKTTQRDLLLSADKTKAVIVKFSFKDTAQTALVKFEFSKKINEETKTVESLHLKISTFGFADEMDETLLNFIKACALENTLWQNTKPFIVGGTLIGSALVAGFAISASQANKAALTTVRPIFEGLAAEMTRQLNRYHQTHPESYVRHTHDKYTEPWFSQGTRVEPWFEYCEPTAHEGLWEHVGLTFASKTPSEYAHRKDAGVVATAWLSGSFAALCQAAETWEQPTSADQDRIVVVPLSVLKHDIEQNKEGTLAEQLNAGNWALVVINETAEEINVTTDSEIKKFLASVETYVVVTTAKLAEATTTKFEASCKINMTEFNVTAGRANGATPQETIARLTVEALLSTTTDAVVYTEPNSGTPTTTKNVTITKTNAATTPSTRRTVTPLDITGASHLSLPRTLGFSRDLNATAQQQGKLKGMELFVASTNLFSEQLKQFLSCSVTIGGKQAPRVVIIPSPLMGLCKNTDFFTAVNAAHATVIAINTGETDVWEEFSISTSAGTITKTAVNFVDKAQTALAEIERAIIVPLDVRAFTYKSKKVGSYTNLTGDTLSTVKTSDTLNALYNPEEE